jgi:hypothetical protein
MVKINSSIEEKIAWVEACSPKIKDKMLNDDEIIRLVNRFKRANQNTWDKMRQIGLTHECEKCALNGGSCCGKGIEDKYDSVILFINSLLGVKLASKRLYPKGCYFLGFNGCILIAREVICVNYLCRKLLKRIKRSDIINLQQIAGKEMDILFALQERIKKQLNPKYQAAIKNVKY